MGFWNQFEGKLLDGQFKLSKYSKEDGPCAVFLSELPGQEEFVAVKIIRSASLAAQRLNASWRIAKDLQHPNLIRVYATATADLEGLRVLYAVLDCPDASLADVIEERPLNEDEGRELLGSCADALQCLHQRGLVHTRVRPVNIVAIEQTTKLSTDYLTRSGEQATGLDELDRYDAPELNKTGYSPASDIRALGATLFEALTQAIPAGNTDPRLYSLPGPFPEIVGHCLDPKPAGRWSARQILSHLQSGTSASASVDAKPIRMPVARVMPESSPSSAPGPERRTALTAPANPPEFSKPNLLERWVLLIRNFVPLRYGVSAALIILCLGWLARTSQRDHPSNGTAGAAGFAEPSPSTPVPQDATANNKPSPMPSPLRAVTRSGTADRVRSVWRVVVYTYSNPKSALAKAQDINSQAPRLNAQVFSPAGERSHMVVVGGKMTREVASNLRTQLLDEGFPKDIYIQNFPE